MLKHRINNYIEDKATQIVFQLENFMSFDRNGIQWEHFTWAHILSSDKLGGFKNIHALPQKRPITQGMLTGELQNGKQDIFSMFLHWFQQKAR